MKRLFGLTLLVVLSAFSISSYASDQVVKGVYIGIGGTYAVENFGGDAFEIGGGALDLKIDDTWGVNLKLGYHFNELFAIEFDFDWLSEFEADEKVFIIGTPGTPVNVDGELEVLTYMLVAKFSPDLGSKRVRPFGVVGFGLMDAEAFVKATVGAISAADSDSDTDTCGKLGLGVDYFATQNISIGLEVNHLWGFGDLDGVRYFNITLGVAYHF